MPEYEVHITGTLSVNAKDHAEAEAVAGELIEALFKSEAHDVGNFQRGALLDYLDLDIAVEGGPVHLISEEP